MQKGGGRSLLWSVPYDIDDLMVGVSGTTSKKLEQRLVVAANELMELGKQLTPGGESPDFFSSKGLALKGVIAELVSVEAALVDLSTSVAKIVIDQARSLLALEFKAQIERQKGSRTPYDGPAVSALAQSFLCRVGKLLIDVQVEPLFLSVSDRFGFTLNHIVDEMAVPKQQRESQKQLIRNGCMGELQEQGLIEVVKFQVGRNRVHVFALTERGMSVASRLLAGKKVPEHKNQSFRKLPITEFTEDELTVAKYVKQKSKSVFTAYDLARFQSGSGRTGAIKSWVTKLQKLEDSHFLTRLPNRIIDPVTDNPVLAFSINKNLLYVLDFPEILPSTRRSKNKK